MPALLLYSPHHSDLAVMLYALIDILSGLDQGPAAAKREWLANRLDVSPSGIGKALGQLTHEHVGADDLTPDMPAFLVSRVRGRKLSALRDVVRSIPRVKIPEAAIGTEYPIVTPAAFRLYGILLDRRRAEHGGAVKLSRAELAQLARRKPKTITNLVKELVDAGWVVKGDIAGDTSVIVPLATLDPAGMDAALAALERALPAAPHPVENEVEKLLKTRETGRKGGVSAGTSPGVSEGTSGGSSAGTSIERVPAYLAPAYEDPSSGASVDPAGRRAAVEWCGRCVSPSRRVHVDPDTNRRTPCPTCAPPLRVVA